MNNSNTVTHAWFTETGKGHLIMTTITRRTKGETSAKDQIHENQEQVIAA